MINSPQLLTRVAAATSLRDRDDLDRAIAGLLLHFLEAQHVALFRLSDDGPAKRLQRRVVVGSGLADEQAPDFAALPSWQDCIDRSSVVECAGPEGRVITLFPICHERAVAGVLAIDASATLVPRDAELVDGIMQIARNHLALLDYGELDTLTGLLNRKTLDSRFEKLRQGLVSQCAGSPTRQPSWLALMDIDRFKLVNDNFGHVFGDEVLLLISQELKRGFRGADQLYRFGGEEFLIVLDEASDEGALIVLERLRSAVELRQFPQVGHVTVSVGYTRIDAQDLAAKCVERADAALYYAKSHGRNNVRCYESLIEAGQMRVKQTTDDIELF